MSNRGGREAPASISRTGSTSRHQVKRSISEIAAPILPRSGHSRHQSHLSQHLRKERYNDQPAQPGYQMPARYSMDVSRPDVLSHSRHPSMMGVVKDENRSRTSILEAERKASKQDLLRQEREKAKSRADGLKQSLVQLHTFSTTATRRLDQTYYAILEKTSALQSTVAALKDLTESSKEIYTTFEKDSKDLETDITSQLNALGHFDEQQTKIESLRGRIHEGRAKVQALSARVDSVRERVEGWERADQEWRDKTRKRLRVVWTAIFLLLVIIAGLFMMLSPGRSLPSPSPEDILDSLRDAPLMETPLRDTSPNIPELDHVPLADVGGVSSVSGRTLNFTDMSLVWARPAETEDRLREFDEL
ncbi:unnamed protein product [Clonostachys chloroleuca]|uniref:Uncharacterized protein n=1 Tax=Clonostachys chloroleuca TaxID=1926264 RepID=A0AA35PYL1_9HYPO|nr:unnamed protein product [Clonostachys chloroleuca]